VPVSTLASLLPSLKYPNPPIPVQIGVEDGCLDGLSLGLLLGSLDRFSDGMVLRGALLVVLLGFEHGVEDGCLDGWSLGLLLGSLTDACMAWCKLVKLR
jgi:hypothetical protein